MPRLNTLAESDLGEVAETLKAMEAAVGYAPNSLKTMARKPAIMNALLALVKAVMGSDSTSSELKNMVAQMASKAAGCAYCQAHMGYGSQGAGVSAEKMDALWEFETSDLFSDAERAALRVAFGSAQVPNGVTDEQFDELKKHYTEDQIVEIIAMASLFGFFNRWNDTIATELEASPLQFAQEILGDKGWDAGKHS